MTRINCANKNLIKQL